MDHSGMMPGDTLELIVNGEGQHVRAAMLDGVLLELGFGQSRVATALNGDFVPVGRRAATALKPGDRLEIVTARQGG